MKVRFMSNQHATELQSKLGTKTSLYETLLSRNILL